MKFDKKIDEILNESENFLNDIIEKFIKINDIMKLANTEWADRVRISYDKKLRQLANKPEFKQIIINKLKDKKFQFISQELEDIINS